MLKMTNECGINYILADDICSIYSYLSEKSQRGEYFHEIEKYRELTSRVQEVQEMYHFHDWPESSFQTLVLKALMDSYDKYAIVEFDANILHKYLINVFKNNMNADAQNFFKQIQQ